MAPRQSKTAPKALPGRTLVVDNGAYTIKAGYASQTPNPDQDCHIIPNCIARSRDKRIYVGAQLEECRDFGEMAFRRPVEKGYLVNWEAEKEIWEQAFFDQNAKLKCDPHETNLLLTEAPSAPQSLQSNCDQIIFEEFEFASYYRCMGPPLNAYNNISIDSSTNNPTSSPQPSKLPTECLLIDTGYSHTTVTPIHNGHAMHPALRRLDIGGKLLTNYLKELISIRHFGLMDEPYIVNEIKEKVCFVSTDFARDLDRVWKHRRPDTAPNPLVLDYVLPDYDARQEGYVRPRDASMAGGAGAGGGEGGGGGGAEANEDVFSLGNERFVVPELLFTPSDIGMKQAGLPEMVMQSLEALPETLRPGMMANMVVVGGNAKIPGFMERLESELRSMIPAENLLNLTRPSDPVKATWLGGAKMAGDQDRMKGLLVSRDDYLEKGHSWVSRHFNATYRLG
ncbi:Actin/actin-like protein [Viridothelium virens]|uniref:Actin-like protein ARP6 n=1 Tax=Viridothelium virens TaxID=1048519 RepID=A0A6A6HD84_VIRVR|nr:Actin/actin-like protein [Viridothelium virens]